MAQIVTRSLAEQARDVVRERIISGAINPGTRIEVDELAEEFGISVTPLRDALRLLERDGLIVILPRRGVYTVPVDVKAFRDVFDVRIALECLAVETAVSRIPVAELEQLAVTYEAAEALLARAGDEETALAPSDSAVHDLIVQYCDNDVVREQLATLRDRIAWVRRLAADRAHRYRLSFAEHRRLLAALQDRDAAAAAALLQEHLTRARDHTLAALVAQESVPLNEPPGAQQLLQRKEDMLAPWQR